MTNFTTRDRFTASLRGSRKYPYHGIPILSETARQWPILLTHPQERSQQVPMVKYSKTQEQSVQFKSNPLKHKNSVSETARQNKVSETFRQGPLLLKPNSRTIPACSCGKIFQTTGSYLPKINHPLKHKLSVSETSRQNKVSETFRQTQKCRRPSDKDHFYSQPQAIVF